MKTKTFTEDSIYKIAVILESFIKDNNVQVVSFSFTSVLLGTSVNHYAILIYK